MVPKMLFSKKDFNSVMHKNQIKMQKHAIALAENSGIHLEYELDSMKQIDELLEKIVKEFEAAGLTKSIDIESNDGAKGIAESLGCYIAECAERKQGRGIWQNTDPRTHDTAYCLVLPSGSSIFPIEWIMKKLVKPGEYSVNEAYVNFVL